MTFQFDLWLETHNSQSKSLNPNVFVENKGADIITERNIMLEKAELFQSSALAELNPQPKTQPINNYFEKFFV